MYELIQNAEDNDYSDAVSRGAEPFVHFSLHPDKIFVDSNENGFEVFHVKAICSIGQSSKQNVQGYIGEKGIGFKSVFKVAKKVHIQSGPFSFSFAHSHTLDDDGLGMVTPVNEPFTDLPNGVRTRFTLTPINSSTSGSTQRINEIEALPDTFLLFLRQLKSIRISIYKPGAIPVHTIYTIASSASMNLQSIDKVESGLFLNSQSRKFHVVKKDIHRLPNDNARQGINQAEVVLAFPVHDDESPIVNQQHTYAYLPLRQVGFSVCNDSISSRGCNC